MPKKVSSTPSKDVSALHEKALELIGSKSDGIYQSELRKLLGIKSSKCSKIVSRLEHLGMIKRTPADFGSRRTYLILLASEPLTDMPPTCYTDVGCIDHAYRSNHANRNIDTYLTEFYLLYLIRASA